MLLSAPHRLRRTLHPGNTAPRGWPLVREEFTYSTEIAADICSRLTAFKLRLVVMTLDCAHACFGMIVLLDVLGAFSGGVLLPSYTYRLNVHSLKCFICLLENSHELSWFKFHVSPWTFMWTFTKLRFFRARRLRVSRGPISSHSTLIPLVEKKSPKVIYLVSIN